MYEFNYHKWEKEVSNLVKFNLGGKEKKRLEFLIRQGSQYLEHAHERLVPDKIKMKTILDKAETTLNCG